MIQVIWHSVDILHNEGVAIVLVEQRIEAVPSPFWKAGCVARLLLPKLCAPAGPFCAEYVGVRPVCLS